MKTLSATLLVLLVASASARFLQTDPVIPHTTSLPCGRCIYGGFIYCVKNANGENLQVTSYPTPGTTTNQCCKDLATCTYASDAAWTCSTAFQDRTYAKFTCPYHTTFCGANSVASLTTAAPTATFTIANLPAGQSCFYKVSTDNQAISFKPVGDVAKVEIEYIEFRSDQVATAATVTGQTSVSDAKKSASPVVGMPIRKQAFFPEANSLDKVFGQDQFENTTARTGRVGRYDNKQTTPQRKNWRSTTQNDTGIIYKLDANEDVTVPRSLYLAVHALSDFAATNALSIVVSKQDMVNPPVTKTGASFIAMTFSVILGLFAYTLF